MTNSLLYDLVSQVYMYAQTNEEAPKDQIFEAEKKVIEELAQKGNCVIVGRCSDYILRNRTDCLKIYFSAPIESRVKRVMKRLNLSEKEAKQRIQRKIRDVLTITAIIPEESGVSQQISISH